jgi:hypothetical protein
MHLPEGQRYTGQGGSLSLVTGDLTETLICPGPYDVVIERRTLQLFPAGEQIGALEKLVARLSEKGTFVSQVHSGCWRPGESRAHFAETWLISNGFYTAIRA